MDKELLAMLVCPLCNGKLKYQRDARAGHGDRDSGPGGRHDPCRDGCDPGRPRSRRDGPGTCRG